MNVNVTYLKKNGSVIFNTNFKALKLKITQDRLLKIDQNRIFYLN